MPLYLSIYLSIFLSIYLSIVYRLWKCEGMNTCITVDISILGLTENLDTAETKQICNTWFTNVVYSELSKIFQTKTSYDL